MYYEIMSYSKTRSK